MAGSPPDLPVPQLLCCIACSPLALAFLRTASLVHSRPAVSAIWWVRERFPAYVVFSLL
ncbi:hypothetical protein BU23DRAFT_552009, partial [Bimuria novae-zelandiae CBS 107.79]